jgi:predicted SPOUT superfamily RNA methylase MTH1
METPQYLRKSLFGLRRELQYAGILPPLRTPHHPLNRRTEDLKTGEYREGATLSKSGEGTAIDIGVEKPAFIPNRQLTLNQRVTVKITKIEKQIEVQPANRDEIPAYWGYQVTTERNSLGKLIRAANFDLTIATSKRGVPFADVAGEIAGRWKNANKILVAFGAPAQGLYEILKNEGLNLNNVVDFVVNTMAGQRTETVRTEEALIASLAILSMQTTLHI